MNETLKNEKVVSPPLEQPTDGQPVRPAIFEPVDPIKPVEPVKLSTVPVDELGNPNPNGYFGEVGVKKSAANADISTELVTKDSIDQSLPYGTKKAVKTLSSDPQFVEVVEVPINKVQPGKLAAVANHTKSQGPAKVGSIVLFEAHSVAIITGIWPDGTVNLTVFTDALPMLGIKTQVPLRSGDDSANTWELFE
jgi:hypothetical protein